MDVLSATVPFEECEYVIKNSSGDVFSPLVTLLICTSQFETTVRCPRGEAGHLSGAASFPATQKMRLSCVCGEMWPPFSMRSEQLAPSEEAFIWRQKTVACRRTRTGSDVLSGRVNTTMLSLAIGHTVISGESHCLPRLT